MSVSAVQAPWLTSGTAKDVLLSFRIRRFWKASAEIVFWGIRRAPRKPQLIFRYFLMQIDCDNVLV